jgi:hypothetical protein
MKMARTFIAALTVLGCFNILIMLRLYASRFKVPVGLIAYLAATPISIVLGTLWVAVQHRPPLSPECALAAMFTFKIGVTGMAFLSFLVFDVPEYLRHLNISAKAVNVTRLVARGLFFFALYTLSYGPWVFFWTHYQVPMGNVIECVFYFPLNWLSAHCQPYAFITRELFWFGYGPV